jgi:hypothetical protein
MKRLFQHARTGRHHPGSLRKRALTTLLAIAALSALDLGQDDNSLGDLARHTREQIKAADAAGKSDASNREERTTCSYAIKLFIRRFD